MKRLPPLAGFVAVILFVIVPMLILMTIKQTQRSEKVAAPAIADAATSNTATSSTAARSEAESSVASAPPSVTVRPVEASRGFEARLREIEKLGRDLPPESITSLLEWIADPNSDPGLLPGQVFALKNDALNALREQRAAPPEFTGFMVSLWRDSSQPLVIRDYALQHLAPWFARAGEAERATILDELTAAATEHRESFSGTALLGLDRIQTEHGVEADGFASAVESLLDHPAAHPLARITAAQLAGTLGGPSFEKRLRELAGDETQTPTLRAAALGGLGKMGALNSVREIAETIQPGGHPLLTRSANLVLTRASGSPTPFPSQP